MKRFAIIGVILASLMGLFVGTASATSLSGLGAPPVNNTNCWARDGFGFVEVNCQWGTPYNYAKQLYAPWINSGQIVLYGSYWPTAAGQPNGTTAYHDAWSSCAPGDTCGFQMIVTTSQAAYDFTTAYYQQWVGNGQNSEIVVCKNFGDHGCS